MLSVTQIYTVIICICSRMHSHNSLRVISEICSILKEISHIPTNKNQLRAKNKIFSMKTTSGRKKCYLLMMEYPLILRAKKWKTSLGLVPSKTKSRVYVSPRNFLSVLSLPSQYSAIGKKYRSGSEIYHIKG